MSAAEKPLGSDRSRIPLLVVSQDTVYCGELKAFLQDHPAAIDLVGVLPDLAPLEGVVRSHPGCVVLLDDDLPGERPPEMGQALRAAGAAKVILLVSGLGSDKGTPHMAALFKFSLGSSLVEQIRSLYLPVPTAREAAASAAAPPDVAARPGVFALYSPRGGAGTSTLAANLAHLYAGKGLRVALVDLARHGAQHVMLRQPQRGQGLSSLATLLTQEPDAVGTERLAAHLQQTLMRVEVNRVAFHLLPAAPPNRMDHLSGEHVQAILNQLLLSGFQVVMVDLSPELSDRGRGALETAGRVVVPVLPEIVSAWQALQARDLLGSLLGSRARFSFVLNRFRPDAGFDPDEFVRLGGSPYLGSIPDDVRHVRADLAVGRLTGAQSGAPFTQALRRVAHGLYPVFSSAEVKRGRWPWHKF